MSEFFEGLDMNLKIWEHRRDFSLETENEKRVLVRPRPTQTAIQGRYIWTTDEN